MDPEETKRLICAFLISSSLSDHLGDVRDAETYLWDALGIGSDAFRSTMYETDDDYDSTFRPTRKTLIDHGFFDYLPDYAQDPDDDEDDE